MDDLDPDLDLSGLSREEVFRLCFSNAMKSPELRSSYKDRDGRFLLVSGGWLDAYAPGRTLDEVVGQTNHAFFKGPHADAARAEDLRVIETGDAVRGKIEYEEFDDRPNAWVQITRLPLRGAHGKIVGTWALTRDVTLRVEAQQALASSRERLEASERMHREIFERNPQPMWLYDRASWEIFAVNEAAIAVYGYSREEFLALRVLDLIDSDQVPAFLESMTVTEGGRSGYRVAVPRSHRYRDGTIAEVEVTANDVTIDGRACRVALISDVTERNRVAAELAAARDEAVEASNTKSAFLANISHEIRTPMNGVLGMTELLLDSVLDEDQRLLAQQVSSSGEQMVALIDDILDISKIEAGQLALEQTIFALHDAIEQACAVAGIQAAAKGLELEVEIAAEVPRETRGDSRRLRQIVLNLVANAVKFTSEGGITVRASTRRVGQDDGVMRVEVGDSGIGIAPAVLERMFEPFTQADASTTRHYGGTGLGLAIARELTELMGGTIGARSEPATGSTFWFELPLVNEKLVTRQPARDQRAGASRLWLSTPVVLVAEDSPVNQTVAVRTLERFGCQVEVVADGRQALEKLSARRYDAVLMDCQMADMDGYEATIELRRREGGGRHTPVIAMTAHAMTGDRERCLAAGMDDYLSKPLRRQQLADALLRWVSDDRVPVAVGGPLPG